MNILHVIAFLGIVPELSGSVASEININVDSKVVCFCLLSLDLL